MTQLSSLSYCISKLVHEISFRCYNKKTDSSSEAELFCAKTILVSLSDSGDVLSLLSKIHRDNLSDSIKIHGERYLKEYKKYPKLENDAEIFKKSLCEVIEILSTADKSKIALTHSEIDLLSESFYAILKKIQLFFSNQFQNQDSLEFIHASSIAHKIVNSTSFQEQTSLTELLLLVKELWNTEKINISNRFYCNPCLLLQIDKPDIDTIFDLTIHKLTSEETSVLLFLQDDQILRLYDRLKNYEGVYASSTIFELLEKIHIEAQFRYSYNRLSDTGYQLLSRFQNFDAINHQIENLEFNILEAYLFKKSKFTKEILLCIAKHLHNIKALSLNKDEHLLKVLIHIDKKLKIQSKGADGSMAMLSNLKNGLNKLLPSQVKKHYSELDKFHNTALQKKYKHLFVNIVLIFEDQNGANSFLQNLLTQRLASDYYLPHLSNSIEKLRSQAIDRKKVVSLLSDLNFLAIFLPGNFNTLTSFGFRKSTKNMALQTPVEYVKSLIDNICVNINAFQLETLYKSTIHNTKLTLPQVLLIDSIKIQISQRMTVRKLLYSIVSGKKKEYDKLRVLKKISTEHQVVVNP